MILDIIRALDLPNNPLDDIIDQVKSTFLIISTEFPHSNFPFELMSKHC